MYNLLMVMLVILPIYFVMKGDDTGTRLRTFVIRSAALIFANFACLFILFTPKVIHVFSYTENTNSTNVFTNSNVGGSRVQVASASKVSTNGSKTQIASSVKPVYGGSNSKIANSGSLKP